ncbi:FAD-NAD(P)-binding protein [Paracoccus suum]|uniref:FAD-NAD(P)-binding protein n=1 Tax=Paracoccus suum TaxID=2259340 RepID=A0A344PMB2_9RHOB|nr:FAD/NAD(P)-binding protein [Paracoccus suum]AXC50517.1 FAD-NAD(P)-binding protein [Paracoccus suum]
MRIAIVGTGPTGIYTLQSLLTQGAATHVSLFEKGERVGVGIPYSRETAGPTMLANIASIEIPPVIEPFIDWLRVRSDAYLSAHALDRANLTERTFAPRVVLGDYYHDQINGLIQAFCDAGVDIEVHESCRVTDLKPAGSKIRLSTRPRTDTAPFEKVVLATGHVFEPDDDLTDNYFPNPWSGLIEVDVPAARVGIMGTSLSAIDAAMAVAVQHGKFVRDRGALTYRSDVENELMLTLMSRNGLLPEADFYCPIPYIPLEIMTPDALREAVRQENAFDAVYDLFRSEIAHADPSWAVRVGLAELTPELFERAYFHDREANDPFRWARANLEEAEANHRARLTVAWRYAILRMHEKVQAILPELSEPERERFDLTLKKVFVDNYAAVPPESIHRLLALRDAGVLSVLELGEDYGITHQGDETVILVGGRHHVFDVFIDARGQKPMETKDLPFPTLRQALLNAGYDSPDIAEDFGLLGLPPYADKVYLAASPYLLKDRPFVQGITACADIGKIVAAGCTGAAHNAFAKVGLAVGCSGDLVSWRNSVAWLPEDEIFGSAKMCVAEARTLR